jgi:adenosylcobinamide kinase / adenosylcobinamide-phosphate guanylyltransferase
VAASDAWALHCAHSSGEALSIVLVLGGARSGKSRFAESLAHQPAHYVATAQAFDDEMRERIAMHKVQRGAGWVTHEEPLELVELLKRHSRESGNPADVLGDSRFRGNDVSTGEKAGFREKFFLVDCLTLWLSNLLLADCDCETEVSKLVAYLKTTPSRIVIVSNEVGLGIVPDNALARKFRDIQGFANQRVAEVAMQVVFMVAGLPMAVKGPLPTAQM